MKILGKRLLVERIEMPKLTSTLIEVISQDETPSQFARVLGIGEDIPDFIKVGSRLILKTYSGSPYRDDQVFLNYDDVLAVMDD